MGLLSWAVEGFFANGGSQCWIVREASKNAAAGKWTIKSTTGETALRLVAASPGSWARELAISVSSAGRQRFTLNLKLPDGSEEVWRNLSAEPPYFDLCRSGRPVLRITLRDPALWLNLPSLTTDGNGTFTLGGANISFKINESDLSLTGGSNAVSLEVINRNAAAPPLKLRYLSLMNDNGVFRADPQFAGFLLNNLVAGSHLVRVEGSETVPGPTQEFTCEGGADGLSDLTPDDFQSGLDLIGDIDEIAIIAIPDIVAQAAEPPVFNKPSRPSCLKLDIQDAASPVPILLEQPPAFSPEDINRLQQALVQQCEELKDRMAILDLPSPYVSYDEAIQWREGFHSSFAACYYPWLAVPDPQNSTDLKRTIPPSGHVAGIYARVEKAVGVHKAPANESVEGAADVTVATNDFSHGLLNEAQVNVIRAYPGRGISIAGARTASPTTNWRFISVRRLFIMIERAIRVNFQWIVFEPHDRLLWLQADRVIRTLLEDCWQRGYLDGASRQEAYFVRCDETTNPRTDLDLGKLTCEVGILPTWPAEFVVFRIGITEGAIEIKVPEARVA